MTFLSLREKATLTLSQYNETVKDFNRSVEESIERGEILKREIQSLLKNIYNGKHSRKDY